MTGCAIILGTDRSPHSTYVQLVGDARSISANLLCEAMEESGTLRPMLLKYAQAFAVQASHTAVANARARLHERLARWILMSHDRVAGNTIALTHEFLATMLAVRRAGVTEAVN